MPSIECKDWWYIIPDERLIYQHYYTSHIYYIHRPLVCPQYWKSYLKERYINVDSVPGHFISFRKSIKYIVNSVGIRKKIPINLLKHLYEFHGGYNIHIYHMNKLNNWMIKTQYAANLGNIWTRINLLSSVNPITTRFESFGGQYLTITQKRPWQRVVIVAPSQGRDC